MAIESKRVYELAKEYNIGNKEFIEYIDKELGISVKSHSSGLTAAQVERIKKSFEKKNNLEPVKKPKAFIIKKAKTSQHQEETAKESLIKTDKDEQDESSNTVKIETDLSSDSSESDETAKEPAENNEQDQAAQIELPLSETLEKSDAPEAAEISQTPEAAKTENSAAGDKPETARDVSGYRSLLEYNSRNSRKHKEEMFAQKQRLERERIAAQRKEAAQNSQQRLKSDDASGRFGKDKDLSKAPFDKNKAPFKKAGFDKKSERGERAEKAPEKTAQAPRKPLQHHVISQDIYNGKPRLNSASKKSGAKDKKKSYKNKEEEQELISLEKTQTQKHKKKLKDIDDSNAVKQVIINAPLTAGELSDKIGRPVSEIVKYLMMQGILTTVNEVLPVETLKKICGNFELEVLDEDLNAYVEEELAKEEKANKLKNTDESLLETRAPVVSIMGHVDHGKTTLLDSIRASKHKITASEAGGITQSIGAYSVYLQDDKNKKIVFIDTPGHEAFTEMRARGAKATDIAILVCAADDGIMPQTIEAINHAKAAEIPIICAINKMDKPEANPDKVMQQLTEYGLVPEEWGGDTICVKVSALQGKGIDELLEYVLLAAELQNLRADKTAKASGVIIESKLDKGKGPVATLLVQNGTLHTGDYFNAGNVCGRVRALISDSGGRIKEAGPSTPVEILGLTEVPQAGDTFEAAANEKEMKEIYEQRKEKERASKLDTMRNMRIKNEHIAGDSNIKHLNLIIKANTHGSAEAVSQGVSQLESKEIATKIIHAGVGDISEADVMLASAGNAVILGFAVKEDANAQAAAEKYGVIIKKFNIIYQVLEDLEKTMLGLLQPEIKEVFLGEAEVRKVFTIGKTSKIAGCYVTEGKIVRNKTAVVLRGGKEIFKGQIDQLKRFKDDVKEAAQGFECGISFAKFNDIQEGDIIKVTAEEEVERKVLV